MRFLLQWLLSFRSAPMTDLRKPLPMLGIIEALAVAIDARHHTLGTRIPRMKIYAAGLARALNVPEQEVSDAELAAMLLDVGKLAVPEHVLSKVGPLTQEEFQKIRVHPQVGAEIVSTASSAYPVALLILMLGREHLDVPLSGEAPR